MFDNGNANSTQPFDQSSAAGLNRFAPPPARSNSKLWVIPVAIIGTIASIAAIAFSVWTINLTQQNVQARNGASQEELAPVDSDDYSNESSGDPDLEALNSVGYIAWSPDEFAYMGDYPPRAVYLSEYGNDGSYCGLWLYETYDEALAAEAGQTFYSEYTIGESPANGLGYVLLADSQETECAVQAFDYLGYVR
jgi:hypothetical protein